jgi:hypothetical protein
MARGIGWASWAAAMAVVAIAGACNDSQSPQSPRALLGLPDLGTLAVTVLSSGSKIPNGYTVTVDDSVNQRVDTSGVATFTGLAAGSHTVALRGVPGFCSVSDANPRSVSLLAGVMGTTSFSVSCSAPPPPPPPPPSTGDLTVTTSTGGSNLDSDGYTVTVDSNPSKSIGTNDSVTFKDLHPGNHQVALSGVASNCTVSGGTSQTVKVPERGTASTSFAVSCAPTTGTLTVNTSTTGSDLDPDGYTVTVDGATSQAVATNGNVPFTEPAGDHSVALSGIAGNCTVSGANPRTVTVPAGGAATTTFDVSCTTPGGSGGGGGGEVIGQGQIGTGSPTPGSDATTFDFDIRADLTGRFTGTDWGDLHGTTPATLTTDPVADPATSFTAYRNSSTACADPTRGVEVDAVGREDNGSLVAYTMTVCDNGPAGSGMDFFKVFIPSENFVVQGTVTSGDISTR